ncbi:hypothetical protein GX586_00935 [bacterium]|nr:hypothetical protein [bacterium]
MTDRKPLLPILPVLAAALVLRPLPSTAFQASVFDGDVVISEFAAATSDRVVYWPEDGSAPRLGMGIPWTDLTYNDNGWLEGTGGFGTSGTGVGTVLNTSGKAYSLYARKTFYVSTNDASRADQVRLTIDFEDGFVAYLNGKEIARKGLGAPGSFVYHDTRANNGLQHCGSTEEFTAGIASNLLAPGANVLAVFVTKTGIYDTPWRMVAGLRLPGAPAVDLVLASSKWKYFIGTTEPLGGLRKPTTPQPQLPEPYLAQNESVWRYRIGTSEPSGAPTLEWAGLEFDDTAWGAGPGGLGYGDPGILTTVNVQNVAWSFYVRQKFEVLPEHLGAGNQLQLSVKYDDGFVAYLNGREIARSGLGTNAFVPYNQAASSHDASQVERFTVNNASNIVVAGTNVLAIQVHNTTIGSGDLSLIADLDMVYDVAGSFEEQNVADDLDWIELHNRGTQTVSIAGWSLTDDASQPGKWVLPNIILAPNSYFLVLASGADVVPTNGAPETNFKLGGGGEYLALMDNGSPRQPRCVFDPAFPPQSYYHSCGLVGAGNEYRYLDRPTPGAENNTNGTYAAMLGAPVAGADRGFYTAPLMLTITPPLADATVMYTTNGTVPALNNGIEYTGAIAITRTTALRARAFKQGHLPSATITHTYLVNEMDVKQTLPAMCLVGDEERDLFEPHGLMAISGGYSNWWPATEVDHYNHGTPTGRAYEWPVSAELIYPDDNRSVQINAGLRTAGQGGRGSRRRGPDWSQQTYKYDLRLYFRSSYGTERLEFPVYTNSPVATFDKICIKSGFWDDCINPALKDELFRRLMLDCGQLASHGIHVNLYINGVYKTYYNLIERPDDEFFRDHYNSTNEWEVMKFAVSEGNTVMWTAMQNFVKSGTNSPLVQANYEWMAARLDLVTFIDYLLVSIYAHNSDWPINNWVCAREHKEGAKFRYLPWDSGCSFGFSGSVTNNTFAKIYSGVPGNAPISIYYNYLHQNPEFRLLFADRIQKHFFGQGALTDRNVSNRYAEMKAVMQPIVTYVQTNYNKSARYNDNVQTDWIPRRRAVVFTDFRAEGVWPSIAAPVLSREGGVVSNGFALTLSNTNASGTIYYTIDGSDPRAMGGAAGGQVYTAAISVTNSIVVRARVLDDGEWSPVNEATFLYAYPFDAVKLSEIMYNPAAGGSEYIELLNTADEAVPLHDPLGPESVWHIEDDSDVMYSFPPGSVAKAGQYIVLVGQDVDTGVFAAAYNVPGSTLLLGPCTRNLGNGGDSVRIFRPDGGGRFAALEQVTYSDDPPWPKAADGMGASLQRVSFDASADDPVNWTAGPSGGTPGRALPEPAGMLALAAMSAGAMRMRDRQRR